MLLRYLRKLRNRGKFIEEDSDFGLFLHALLTVFVQSQGRESLDTIYDTNFLRRLIHESNRLTQLHQSLDFSVSEELYSFALANRGIIAVPEETVLLAVLEARIRGFSFSLEEFISFLPSKEIIVREVAVCFQVSELLAKLALEECEEQSDSFHYLRWNNWFEEIEASLAILKQEDV